MNAIKLLILTANPGQTGQAPLRVAAEVRLIEEALQRSRYRDRFQIATKLAIRTTDLRRALLDHRPQIVHFSGHGTGKQGLVLETDSGQQKMIGTEAISQLFGAFNHGEIECVLLNACYSDVQAIAIHQFVDCVIGMNQPIGDQAAIDFAEGFYDALGAGSPYDEAFKIGKSAITASGSLESIVPVLKHRKQTGAVTLGNQQAQSEVLPLVVSDPPFNKAAQSQSIKNISISGSNNPVNALQSEGDITIDQSQTQTKITNPDIQAVVKALGKLKQAIAATDAIDETEKAMVAIPVQKLETELQKPQPDQSVVGRMIATLRKALDGVVVLAEPVSKVAALIAKAWIELP